MEHYFEYHLFRDILEGIEDDDVSVTQMSRWDVHTVIADGEYEVASIILSAISLWISGIQLTAC